MSSVFLSECLSVDELSILVASRCGSFSLTDVSFVRRKEKEEAEYEESSLIRRLPRLGYC